MEVIVTDKKVELKDLMEMADNLPPPPRMAQIIKRETATEKLLKEIKENGV